MADMNAPFDFSDMAAPNVAQTSAEWAQAMSDPQVRGALLQFGISMLQPPQFGDTFGSQFGRGVGAAGEYTSRLDEEERKRLDAESKAQLRESQAETGTVRAGAAQMAAEAARERTGLTKQLQDQQNRIRTQGRQIQATGAYQKYVNDVNKRNTDVMRDPKAPKEPVLSEQEFYKKFGYSDLLSGVGANAPTRQPSQRAIELLRSDPQKHRAQFDEYYGPGAADEYL